MTKYSEKLLSPEWQKKRLAILTRDSWTCLLCSDTHTTFHVHHKEYLPGRLPWQYDDDNFMTLCKHCHAVAEKTKAFSDEVLTVDKKYDPAIEAYVMVIVVSTFLGLELCIFSYSTKYDELNKMISFSEQELTDFSLLIQKAKSIQNPNHGKRPSNVVVLE